MNVQPGLRAFYTTVKPVKSTLVLKLIYSFIFSKHH